mgnify:CR=1 FL=1
MVNQTKKQATRNRVLNQWRLTNKTVVHCDICLCNLAIGHWKRDPLPVARPESEPPSNRSNTVAEQGQRE